MTTPIEEFNRADAATAAATVSVWAAVPTWVAALVAGRPYESVEELAAAAEALAAEWSGEELDAALAHHPRIGGRVCGSDADAVASRREQASMASADDAVAERIRAGNVTYEERFGRVFLIRAAGRPPEEMLAELERRLGNDAETEVGEAVAQLVEIALTRLRGTVSPTVRPDRPAPPSSREDPA